MGQTLDKDRNATKDLGDDSTELLIEAQSESDDLHAKNVPAPKTIEARPQAVRIWGPLCSPSRKNASSPRAAKGKPRRANSRMIGYLI